MKRVRSRGVRVIVVSDSELTSASEGTDADNSLGFEHVHSSRVWGHGALGLQDHHRGLCVCVYARLHACMHVCM